MDQNLITLYYAGQRLNGKSLVYAYSSDISKPETSILFSKRLLGYESIGYAVSAIKTDKGVKLPCTLLKERAPKKIIEFWSIQELTDAGKHQLVKKSSEKLDGNVFALIEAIKKYSPARRAVAIQVIIKLL